MIKFEHTEVLGWEHAIRGMRNPMNSWEKSDSCFKKCIDGDPTGLFELSPSKCPKIMSCKIADDHDCHIGPNDLDLMKRLRNAGTDHRKFMRMIAVYVDITAPLYWWKEFDTYKVGTVANSCSTMHKIAAKEFTLEDFSHEHLVGIFKKDLEDTILKLNIARNTYIYGGEVLDDNGEIFTVKPEDKTVWWQMIQLLPSSYNQKRTVMLNYEVLANIYKSRKDHKLDEWREHDSKIPDSTSQALYSKEQPFGFCDWIKTLPYSELITGGSKE